MKKKSSRIALLAFIVVALVVTGVAVWPKPKPALASETCWCFMELNTQFNPPVTDADVHFAYEISPDVWSGWIAADADGAGLYSHTFASLPSRCWRISVAAPYHGDRPVGDVQTFGTSTTGFTWIVHD